MKRIALLALAATGAIAAQAQPGYVVQPAPQPLVAPQAAPSFVDRARVQDVQPQYQVVQVPRQECSSQYVQDAPQVVGGERGYGGAIIGGVAGGLLGNQIGSGGGRAAATILGAVGGAAVGQHLARNANGSTTQAGYRITMQSDNGVIRTYEVPATGDLRVGDRVRVDNGVIYRA